MVPLRPVPHHERLIQSDCMQHGSDSVIYENERHHAPQNFENVFANYDSDRDGANPLSDVLHLI